MSELLPDEEKAVVTKDEDVIGADNQLAIPLGKDCKVNGNNDVPSNNDAVILEKTEVSEVKLSQQSNDVAQVDTMKHEETDEEKDKTQDSNQEDEEEESESDEELPPGLLERPIEILSDKRERKKTTRLTYDEPLNQPPEKKKLEIPEGRGIKLSEHPRVEHQLIKNKTEDLKIIHRLFFGTFGDAFSCRKNMRNFSGFPFGKDSPEFEKKEDYLGKFTLDNLKWALVVCDVENRKGKKEDLMAHFLDWCLCPEPSGKEVPVKKKKENASKKKAKSRKPTNQAKASSKKSKSPEQKSPKKRKSAEEGGKSAKIKINSLTKKDGDSKNSDKPPEKKAKKATPPTDAKIRKAVEGILKGADLEETTMKSVCEKIYSMFPSFDLSDRKPFIKETVKSIIS